MSMIYAGLDLGGTKCAAVLAETNGEEINFLDRREVPTQGHWRDVMAPLLDFLKGHSPVGCGISWAAPSTARRG